MPESAIAPLGDHRALAWRVYDALKQDIFGLILGPGAQLVERDLARRFGVSKSPVRDALQRLAGEGLVIQSDYRGVSVREITFEEADEIYAFREVLEEMAVTLATPRLTDADFIEAVHCLERSQQAMECENAPLVAQINRDFHAVFSKNCGNRPLHDTLANLQNRVRIISVLGWRWRPSMHEDLRQHRDVLDAARRGASDEAGHLMREHIHRFRVAYQEARNASESPQPNRPVPVIAAVSATGGEPV
jgi:DNA-binding GntR family transcriptional regulator